jgi:hypothetical protein
MKKTSSACFSLGLVALFIVSSFQVALVTKASPGFDYDPLVDKIYVTVTIKEIRALDRDLRPIDFLNPWATPNFFVVVSINGNESTSPVWRHTMYVKNPGWSVTVNVPKNVENVAIKIQLFDKGLFGRRVLCKLSANHHGYPLEDEANLIYSLKTGHWTGDDWVGDPSGYGCLNGCDDNSAYQHERNCLLRFDINQTDPTGDGIPYWEKKYAYRLDPTKSYAGFDPNNDSIPITWDWKWEYNPFAADDHSQLDPDRDALTNLQEYRTAANGSDPFRRDIFLEVEQMELGPQGQGVIVPELAGDLIVDAFARQDIGFHIINGTVRIPFQTNVTGDDLQDFYLTYFLQGNPDNWKRGVFHCGFVTYHCEVYQGFTFESKVKNRPTYVDCFQIATRELGMNANKYLILRIIRQVHINKAYSQAIIYGSAMMHETGHVLGINHGNTPGCDNHTDGFPWQKDWWVWCHYRSVMNYGWMFTFVDYSDGHRGKNDFDDWARIDLSYFNTPRDS